MTELEMKKALDDKFVDVETSVKDIKTKVEATETKLSGVETELAKSNGLLKTIGEDIESIKSHGTQKNVNFSDEIEKFFVENLTKISTIRKSGAGVIEFVPKAVTTGSGSNVGTPNNVGYSKPDVIIEQYEQVYNLFKRTKTKLAAFPYTELVPSGNAGVVAEGGLKPEVGFTWVTRWSEPKKVAAHEILSEEVEQDIPYLMSLAEEVLLKKHNIKKVKDILDFVVVQASAFVPGALSATITTPQFMDVINAASVSIYTKKNYADDVSELPNAALVNPVDFFTNFVSAKNNNGNYMYPSAVFYNYAQVGGLVIVPSDIVASGKVLVADLKSVEVVDYKPYYIKLGWINDQLIHNMFTMVGESRYHLFIREQHKKRLIYDDYADILTAITKP